MKKSFLFLIIFTITSTNLIIAQVSQDWAKYYFTPQPQYTIYPTVIALDSSGNVYSAGGGGIWSIVKYNSYGNQLWYRNYNLNSDYPKYIAIDPNGDVYLAGYVGAMLLVKVSRAGIILWQRTFKGNGSGNSWISGLYVTPSGYPIVGGSIYNNGSKQDFCVVKFSPEGDTIWSNYYNTQNDNIDYATSFAHSKDGNICVTGYTINNTQAMDARYLAVMFDSSGNFKWSQIYGDIDSGYYANDAAIDNSGNVLMTGDFYVRLGNPSFGTVKFSSDGIFKWVKSFHDSSNNAWGYKIVTDNNKNVIIAGSGGYNSQAYLTTVKYDSSGNLLWNKYFHEINDSTTNIGLGGNNLACDNSGNIYLTGTYKIRYWPPPAIDGMFTLKYRPDGSINWIMTKSGNYNNRGAALVLNKNGNVFSVGSSFDSTGIGGFITTKYSQTVGIINQNETINSFELFQNYPNPFNPITNVKFSILNSGQVKLIVYDIQGREVQTLVNESLKPGTYEATFDGSQLTSGVYFYKLITDGYSETRKMLMIK
jgi:hypothetical protein